MSHMVIYRTGDGQPGYHQAEELDEAVRFVERLRNGDGVESARIFHMEEVNFDFRPYFKVEIGPAAEPQPEPKVEAAPSPAPSLEPEPAPAPAPPAPVPTAGSDDAWGNIGTDPEPESEPTPLVEQAASFMPDTDSAPSSPVDGNGSGDDEGVGARRGLFGR